MVVPNNIFKGFMPVGTHNQHITIISVYQFWYGHFHFQNQGVFPN